MRPLWTLAHICVAVGLTLCCPSLFLLMLWHILQVPSALSQLLWLASHLCAWLGRPLKFCFSLYARMNCVTCWTFICCCCQRAEVLMCPGLLVPSTAFFLPVFSSAVPSRGFSQQYLWLATANQPYLTTPTKQVNRSSNSHLYNSHVCSLSYTLKIRKLIISNHVFNHLKEKNTH